VLSVRLGSVGAILNNDVLRLLRLAVPDIRKDFLRAGRVAGLGIKRRARVVRSHGVTTRELRVPLVRHVHPRVAFRGRLGVRDVTAVAVELAGLDRRSNVLRNGDGTSRRVDDPRSLLRLRKKVLVEEMLGTLVERRIDRDHITLLDKLFDRVHALGTKLLLGGRIELVVVVVEQLSTIERLQALKNATADPADTHSANDLVLQVVRILRNLRNIPTTRRVLPMRGDEVAHEIENRHHRMLGHGCDVRSSDLVHADLALVRLREVNVVAAHSSSHRILEILGLVNALCREITGVERRRDDNVRIHELLVELRVGPILIGGGDQSMALLLDPTAQT